MGVIAQGDSRATEKHPAGTLILFCFQTDNVAFDKILRAWLYNGGNQCQSIIAKGLSMSCFLAENILSACNRENRQREKGFTLVELAIALTVVGLLVVALLKGQEIVQNARANTLMRQIKSTDAGVAVFMDSYGYLPGDIRSPSNVLSGCDGGLCMRGGNGNGIIQNHNPNNPTGFPEEYNFFPHLSYSGVISFEIQGAATVADATANPLKIYPKTVYNRYVRMAYMTHAVNEDPLRYWYNVVGLPPKILFQIDSKLDDRHPNQGVVQVRGAGCPTKYDYVYSLNEYDMTRTSGNVETCELSVLAGF